MFSSGNNTNNNNPYHHHPLAVPFYQYSSSSPHPLMSQDTDSNILYHYYQHPLLGGQQLLPGYVAPQENTAAANMAAAVAALNNSSNASASGVAFTNALPERPVKKDRHSKIYTAQGLRDRRVRLSTEIARQFFDLQDLLGYDKASETIAWLLNKSKKDIRELVEMKTKNFSSPSDSGMFPVNNHQGFENGEPEGTVSQKDLFTGTSKENKKMKSQTASEFQLHRKDSRTTKARETAEKFHGLSQPGSTIHHFEVGEKSGSLRECAEFGGKSTDPIANNQFPREDIMEESIMIHRKLKPTSSSLGYQHNFSCLPQNWDMNGAATSASSCDATPSMSLSTELLMSGKAWEACNNQRQE